MSDDKAKKSIAKTLARLRKENGWSLAEVARRADSFPTTIKEIEEGRRMPGVGLLTRIADAFSVSIVEFLEKSTTAA